MKNSGFSASKFCADKIRNIEIFEVLRKKDINKYYYTNNSSKDMAILNLLKYILSQELLIFRRNFYD